MGPALVLELAVAGLGTLMIAGADGAHRAIGEPVLGEEPAIA